MVTLKHLPEFNSFDDLKHWVTSTGTFQRTIPNGRVYYQSHVDSSKDRIEVWYHQTPVVTWYRDKVLLDCGGWRTSTTKRRMNQFLPGYYKIYQREHLWYIWDMAGKRDGIEFFNKTKELPYVSA